MISCVVLSVHIHEKLLAARGLALYSAELDWKLIQYAYCHDNELERLHPRTI